MSKTDYSIAGLVGFFTGIFLIPTLVNLGVRHYALLLGIPWVLAACFPVWLLVGWRFSGRGRMILYIVKYTIIGALNAAIDFGILNLLSAASGVASGLFAAGINLPGFILAATHSYFWNRYWVFRSEGGRRFVRGLVIFLGVTFAGAIINGAIVGIATAAVFPLEANPAAWLNGAKVIAAGVHVFWNFYWYRFFVFRRNVSIEVSLQ